MRLFKKLALVAALVLPMQAFAEDPMKVGFVYVGPVGDHGWSYQHDQGRLALEEHFGDKVQTTYVENVSEGADAERTIRKLAQAGNDIIFTTSFGFMNPTARVAKEYPDKTFLHATGYKRSENMGTYLSTTYEGRYVSGTAAGMVTKTNKLGFIASFPIPEVIRDINATFLAARKINPDVELKVVWVSTWFDPAKEADAANTLMDQGVDVIIQHTDSPAAMLAAEKRGIWAVGQASDMSRFGPEAHLLSVVDDWAPYYIQTVQQVMDGTWKSEDYWGGIHEGDIKIASISDRLTDEQRKKIDDTIEAIGNGSLHPFTGPLKDQSGKLRVPEGKDMTKEELAGMNWYVEGMTSTLPK
ncbi:BMP family ABC transporter substrate-binding protein [Marinobacter sp. BGYM27]|uniref:BMP family ABC transporter substrate-binding protein n=1 Tax=Marinobacter sp. BGYM27 TaxID=2975597 RepID=UPI0021A88D2D|nr:BMP family ABC transporter substrate-binding protein [Marinobacter sp. BGYM27]MDG5499978.1 BMP family ABC transporter substrate-binding protein [Marinobacter sp. BGYM27]